MGEFFRITCPSCHESLTFYKEDVHAGLEMFKGEIFCFICKECGRSICTKENPFTRL